MHQSEQLFGSVVKKQPTKRSAATLRRITEAAAREITLHGFDNLSVHSIAEASGMSLGGIYRYISTKSDLLEMVCRGI